MLASFFFLRALCNLFNSPLFCNSNASVLDMGLPANTDIGGGFFALSGDKVIPPDAVDNDLECCLDGGGDDGGGGGAAVDENNVFFCCTFFKRWW